MKNKKKMRKIQWEMMKIEEFRKSQKCKWEMTQIKNEEIGDDEMKSWWEYGNKMERHMEKWKIRKKWGKSDEKWWK